MMSFGSSSAAFPKTDDDDDGNRLLQYRETLDEEDALLLKKDASSSSQQHNVFSRKWTKVLAGSGIAVVATSIALSGRTMRYGPAPRRLGEGETLNESKGSDYATKTIKLHTACAPLHVLDFRPDPTTWKKNMGARIIVRSQQNPELAFDRGIEMTATACGAFEVDARALAPGDEFTFALYEKNGPNGPAFRKDAGCVSSPNNPESCTPENNLGRNPNNMFNMNECTTSTFSDSTKTFYDRVYKESDGRSFVWGSCHSDCSFAVQSELALCELDAQQLTEDGQQPQTTQVGGASDADEPSDGSVSGLLNTSMSSQKVFVPAITNSEHTQASAASALTANEMTPKEILAMDKADLKGAADEENQSKEDVPEPANDKPSEDTSKTIPENETPAQKVERLQKELKAASDKAQMDAEKAAKEEKKALDIVAKETEMEQSAKAAATATTTTTDATAQAQAEQTQPVSTPTIDQLNDLQSQEQQQQQQPTGLETQMKADAAAIASPEESSTTTTTTTTTATGGWKNDAAVTLQAEKEGRKDGPCNYDGCPIEEIIAAQQAAIREQEEATRKAKEAEEQAAAAEKQAKMDVENDRKAEIARIQAESQSQIDRQTQIEKTEIEAARKALHHKKADHKMSHKSKPGKFTTDTGEEHNEVVELEVSPAARSEEEGALAEEDKEQGVKKSEQQSENIQLDQPEPFLSEEEEEAANAQRDEIDEIMAHADDEKVLEKERKEAAKKKSSSSSEEDEEIDFEAAKKALAKAAKVEAHRKAVQQQLEEEKEEFEAAKAKKEQEARERRAARAKAKADAIRFAGKTPEEIELMKRMDALDEMSAAIDREEVKSKKKADKANKNAMAIGVSPEEQLMLDELNGSMDEEGAKEAADALASVEFDDSVFSSNDDKEEEQEEEMSNNNDNKAAIGESEEDSSNSGGALEGSLESSYEEPASNVDPMSLKPRKWRKVATTVPLSEGTDTGAMEAKVAKMKRQEKRRNKVDPETGLTKEEQKLIDSLNFKSPAEDDSFANGGDEAGEAALGERKTFDAPVEEEGVASLGVSPRALAKINKNRMYNEAIASLGDATVASKFEMAAQQARALTKLGNSEDDVKMNLEERMRQLESGEVSEEPAVENTVATPEVSSETSYLNDPIAAQYMPKDIETNGMTKEEIKLITNINVDEEEEKRKKVAAKAATKAAAKAAAEAKANAPKPYHEKGMIVIQNVKVPHTFKLDPYKNIACNPWPKCIAGVPIPGIGCCPEELMDKKSPTVGEMEKEKETSSDDKSSRKPRYERYETDELEKKEERQVERPREYEQVHHSYFSQRDVDERVAPKEEFEEELATTSYDFVPEKKEHGTHHARQSSSSSSVSEEGEKVETHDVADSSSTPSSKSSSKKSVKKEDVETASTSSSSSSSSSPKPEYNQAISDRQKAEVAAEKAREDRIEAEKNAADAKKAYEEAMKMVKTSEKKEEKKAAQAYIAEQKVNHLNDKSRFGESRLAKAPGKKARKVCQASKWKDLEWPFSVGNMSHPSCQSENGGVNDMGNVPEMCDDDLASVRISVRSGKAECMLAQAKACKIPMHDFKSLNYDWTTSRCSGVWAAPLWMSPDTWQWGPGSGEIDGSEFCMRRKMQMNFAGGGHEVEVDNFNINEAWGHTTIRKDDAGIITATTCTASEAEANGGECFKPKYKDCKDCEWGERGSDKEYACWCNEDPNQKQVNIYGSGGCSEGANCEWTLLSDVWNGVGGDQSYKGCMGEIPELGLDQNEPNYNSHCEFSVENILVKGHGLNGALQWGKGSPSYCRHLTVKNKLATAKLN